MTGDRYNPPGNDDMEYPAVTRGQAAYLLDRPSPKMARLLKRRGLWEHDMSFEEAKRMIDGLSREEGWRRR